MSLLSNTSAAIINSRISIDTMNTSTMMSIDNDVMAKTKVHSTYKDDLCAVADNNRNNINKIWSKETFKTHENGLHQKKSYLKASLSLDLKPIKTTWASKNVDDNFGLRNDDEEEEDVDDFSPKSHYNKQTLRSSPTDALLSPDKEFSSPSHHARRPMNAFLIFCKKHRPIVRQRFPHLENRGVTRILGEWWALLDISEKTSYTSLAKEYKDAFFSANPDFKWYKLPAPPLRTLNTRPVSIHQQKSTSPLSSPMTQIGNTGNSAEFTPGKLADETQLGNLTSLMNISDVKSQDTSTATFLFNNYNNNNNNNIVEIDSKDKEACEKQLQQLTPTSAIIKLDISDVPKPIKKRKFEEHSIVCFDNNKKVARNIFNNSSNDSSNREVNQNDFAVFDSENNDEYVNNEEENMTQQDLLNKVVDSMFVDEEKEATDLSCNNRGLKGDKNHKSDKETRKSGRSCKGKRYAEFMMEGKLLGSKQLKKQFHQEDIANKFENVLNSKIENMHNNKNETSTPKLDLGDMIKRLAERTNVKLEDLGEEEVDDQAEGNNNIGDDEEQQEAEIRRRTESENSEDAAAAMLMMVKSPHHNFNLDLRIAELPCLSYEMFLQRKKDSKKRKSVRSKSESSVLKTKVIGSKSSGSCMDGNYLVGSKKRKNKSSITRLEVPSNEASAFSADFNNDLFALATLAEVAANTEKIN